MKINYNGKEIEAYRLIMTKANALEILKGQKNIEIRSFSPHYDKMFTDVDKLARNGELRAQGRDDECTSIIRDDIGAVHFTNYNKSWHLNVLIDEIGICPFDEDGIKFMNEEFGFHELDEQFAEYVPEDEEDDVPMFYYLHITDVIEHNGLV